MSEYSKIEIKREEAEALIKGAVPNPQIYTDQELENLLFTNLSNTAKFTYSVVKEYTGKLPTYWNNRFAFTTPPDPDVY